MEREMRCYVCGALLGVIDRMYFGEVCSEECYNIYYSEEQDDYQEYIDTIKIGTD